MKKVKYLIIGGGISGLAFAAQKREQDYVVLEAGEQCGGLCQSFFKEGFVWDVAGHFFHFHSEDTKQYVLSLLQDVKMVSVNKCAKVYYSGTFMDAPFQYNIHQLPANEFIECLTDLYYSDHTQQDLTFEEYVRKKYGAGIANKFLIPYNSKLYACSMNDLEKDSMGAFLPELDFSMLMNFYKGAKEKTYNGAFLYPVDGCREIINALVGQLEPARIHLNEKALHVDVKNRYVKTEKQVYQYDYLINTAPLNAFAQMLDWQKDIPLNYNQVLVLNLGFDKASFDPDVHWAYFPGDEIFYRVGFYNNIAGTERLSLYVEIGYNAHDEIDVDAALKKTLFDLKRVGIINAHRLMAYHSYVINPGYVHITSKGKKYTDALMRDMEKEHVYMIGRYARWQYSAMDDSLEQAFALAKEI